MSAAATISHTSTTAEASAPEATPTTLLELVRVVSEVTQDEREIVAAIQHMPVERTRIWASGSSESPSPSVSRC